MKIVIDHLRGSRRGQRQEFVAPERVTIGRHPRNDVSFDAHRDLDSSARHAELRRQGETYHLCDIGSSNGTFVAGARVDDLTLEPGRTVEVEFGTGGPVLRLWCGGLDHAPEPAPGLARHRPRRAVVVSVLVVIFVLVTILIARL